MGARAGEVTTGLTGLTGLLLTVAGGLLTAASWQRWTAPCPDDGPAGCELLQDHRHDVLLPGDPWEPLGRSAELAGTSLVLLALALVLLPWALTGRRPGRTVGGLALGAGLAGAAVGAVLLASGLAGERVAVPLAGPTAAAWVLLTPALLVVLAVAARGWARASAVLLLLGSPLVAMLTYAIGPYDAQPWWEAWSGGLTAAGGLLLLAASARRTVSSLSDRPRPTTVSVTIGR